jgi:hypothetical protein
VKKCTLPQHYAVFLFFAKKIEKLRPVRQVKGPVLALETCQIVYEHASSSSLVLHLCFCGLQPSRAISRKGPVKIQSKHCEGKLFKI